MTTENKYVEKARKLAKEAKEKRKKERKKCIDNTNKHIAATVKKTQEVLKMLEPFNGLKTDRGHFHITCPEPKMGWIYFIHCDWNVAVKNGRKKYMLDVEPDAIFLSGHVPFYDPPTKFTSYDKLLEKIVELIAKWL